MTTSQPVRRIAILNCYLQCGRKKIAETEAALRFITAGNNLGVEVRVFARSEDVYSFNPDLIICHSYQDAKLTPFPTYGTLTMPPKMVSSVARFKRNIMSYDAYIGMSESVDQFVDKLAETYDKTLPHVYCAFSVPRSPFVPSNYANAYAAYLGTNWDGNRHGDFFAMFEGTSRLKCYGPPKNWRYLHRSVYGGPVPFDGTTSLKVYHKAGIGLCLNHRAFDEAGIPTSRIFEIPASSAIIIAGHNSLIRGLYGDSALYVDSFASTHDLFLDVTDKIEWVRAHPKQAAEMAERSHAIFNERLCMEVMLRNLLVFHARTFGQTIDKTKGHTTALVSCDKECLADIAQTLESLASQLVKPQEVVLVHETHRLSLKKLGSGHYRKKLDHLVAAFADRLDIRIACAKVPSSSNSRLCALKEIAGEQKLAGDYVLLLEEGDLLFSNHIQVLEEGQQKTPGVCFSGMVERNRWRRLSELMRDEHAVPRKEHRRMLYFHTQPPQDFANKNGLTLLGSTSLPIALFKQALSEAYDMPSFMRNVFSSGQHHFIPMVTLDVRSRYNPHCLNF